MDPNVISESTQTFPSRTPAPRPGGPTITDETPSSPPPRFPSGAPQHSNLAALNTAKPEVERDGEQVSVDLPSKFVFYSELKSLSVKPIRGIHQAKFARSAREKSNRHMADAISSLLPDNVSAYDLTLPDYYWLLYFLRLTFYPKSALIHRSVCTNPDHVLAVAQKKKAKDSLITVTTISKSNLKDIEFDPVAAFAGFDPDGSLQAELASGAGLMLVPTTVRDMTDLEAINAALPEGSESEAADIEYLADFAGFVQTVDQPSTLAARIEIVKNLPPHLMDLIEDYRNRASNYGAEETIIVTCGECGAKIETSVSISAHSFL